LQGTITTICSLEGSANTGWSSWKLDRIDPQIFTTFNSNGSLVLVLTGDTKNVVAKDLPCSDGTLGGYLGVEFSKDCVSNSSPAKQIHRFY
jgi:hypothetical protein